MLALARANAADAGVGNHEFLHGHIEDIPLPDGHVDVVISNCVINLSPDKAAVLAEAFHVPRPGGRIGVTDASPVTRRPTGSSPNGRRPEHPAPSPATSTEACSSPPDSRP